MSRIGEIGSDPVLLQDLRDFITGTLEKRAIEKVFNREDVTAIAEAKDILDMAIESLSDFYGYKNTIQKESIQLTNEAR